MKWAVVRTFNQEPMAYELVTESLTIWVEADGEGGWLYRCPAIDLDWTTSTKTSPTAVQREAVRTVHKIVRAMFIEANEMFAKYGRANSVKEEEAR